MKRYGEVEAVRGVSFAVDEGEVFGLLGPNGAGKTSTIEVLEGLRVPDGGTVTVCGLDPQRNAKELKNVIGATLQATSLPEKLRVSEAIHLFAGFYKRNRNPDELLKRFGLEEKRTAFYGQLSGGQKQRLALALALVNDPQVLFLDEPTAGLDPQVRREIYDIIEELKREKKTIVLTTHYIEEAEKLCDRVAIVDHGKLAALDTPTRLKDSISGIDTVEAEFEKAPSDWISQLQALAHVTGATQHEDVVHITSSDGPATIAALMDLTRSKGVGVRRVSVQSTTLDDVFVHYTGSDLRDASNTGARMTSVTFIARANVLGRSVENVTA